MDRRLRAVIIGCGNIAGGYDEYSCKEEIYTHAKAYTLHPHVELSAVCDILPIVAERFATRWGGRPYSDIGQMLTAERPDLVSICTPDHTHLEVLTTLVPHAPRAVWCEKPLALPGQDPQPAVDALIDAGTLVAVNYIRRFLLELVRIRQSMVTGDLVGPYKVIAHYTKGFQHSGSHFADLFLDWLGPTTNIQVLSRHIDYHSEDPTLDLRLDFASGSVAYLLGGDEPSYAQDEIDLHAANGRVRITDYLRRTEWYRAMRHSAFPVNTLTSQPEIRNTGAERLMLTVLENILSAINGEGELRSDTVSALATFALCEAVETVARGDGNKEM